MTLPRPLRLASYNIRKAVGLDWRRDPARICRVIAGLGADVVALQEADKRLGPRPAALDAGLIARMTDLEAVPLEHSEVSVGWHGNAILVRRGLPHSAVRPLALPGIEPRGCLMVRIDTGHGPVTVVGVHLGLRRGCRRLQLATILEALPPEDRPRAVILGDYNEWSRRQGLEGLEGFSVVAPGRSFHAARPVAALDRIAHGRGLTLVSAGLERGGEARVASDHLPIWADLLPAPAAAGGSVSRVDALREG